MIGPKMRLCALFVLMSVVNTSGETDKPNRIVLMIDRVGSKFVYKLDSKIVPTPKLIDRLVEKLPKHPGVRPTPGLILLVHNKVTLEMIGQAEGLVTKVGYDWPQVFYFSDDKRYMNEVKFSNKTLPFSATGEVLKEEPLR